MTEHFVPRRDPTEDEEPFLDFAANYVLRSVADFPQQGSKAPTCARHRSTMT